MHIAKIVTSTASNGLTLIEGNVRIFPNNIDIISLEMCQIFTTTGCKNLYSYRIIHTEMRKKSPAGAIRPGCMCWGGKLFVHVSSGFGTLLFGLGVGLGLVGVGLGLHLVHLFVGLDRGLGRIVVGVGNFLLSLGLGLRLV